MNLTDLASVASHPRRRSPTSDGWQELPTWPASRVPPASTPNRTCAASCPGAPSAAWTRWPPGGRTWSSTSAGCSRSAGSNPPPYPAGSRSRPGSTGPASSTAPWSTRPPSTSAARRCPPNHPPRGSPTCSSRPFSPRPGESANPHDFALVAMPGLLGLRIFEATGADIADLGEEHLLNTRGARMDRHAATRRLHRLADAAGIQVTRAHPHMLRHIRHDHARRWRRPARRVNPPATPTRGPRCGTTGPAATSTAIPTTSWPPTWHPAHDPACATRDLQLAGGVRYCRNEGVAHSASYASLGMLIPGSVGPVSRWQRLAVRFPGLRPSWLLVPVWPYGLRDGGMQVSGADSGVFRRWRVRVSL